MEALAGIEKQSIVCAGARNALDEAAAIALGQIAERCGIEARLLSPEVLQSSRLRDADLDAPAAVVLSYLNTQSLAHARFLSRRLQRRLPDATIIAGFWGLTPDQRSGREPVEKVAADRTAGSIQEAMELLIAALATQPAAHRPDEAPRLVAGASEG
jgi:hypothetical protein